MRSGAVPEGYSCREEVDCERQPTEKGATRIQEGEYNLLLVYLEAYIPAKTNVYANLNPNMLTSHQKGATITLQYYGSAPPYYAIEISHV